MTPRPLLLLLAARRKAGAAYAYTPEGDLPFTVARATTAYEKNPIGILELVAANVPRFDWSSSICPIILREAQSRNDFRRSEEFNDAIWVKGANVTVTANQTNAPNNTVTADFHNATGATTGVRNINSETVSIVSGTTYTASIFARQGTERYYQIAMGVTPFGTTQFANFDLQTGTVTLTGAGVLQAGIIPEANGFFRLFVTAIATATVTAAAAVYAIVNSPTAARLPSIFYGSTVNVSIWGAQFEIGTLTSYIPTTTAATTRNADVITVTPPVGVTSIVTTFENGSNEEIAPSGLFTAPVGRIQSIVMT
jgi:hypothetical protein